MKKYILVSGTHFQDGKTYSKGDILELNDNQARFLANKIADPNGPKPVQVDSSKVTDENQKLKESVESLEKKVTELEAENALLQDQIDEQEEEI